MYFLKDIQGERVAFPTLKSVFVFLEQEAGKRFGKSQVNYYEYFISNVIGESFQSQISKFGIGYEDTRNKNFYLQENPFEKQWLSSRNKYVVLDAFGRVVAKKLILERYGNRFSAIHERNYRYCSHVNASVSGNKFQKNWSKRLNQRYKGISVCRVENQAMTSKDEFDLEVPIRMSRKATLKAMNLQYDTSVYRDNIRSWKSQSKKKKQWM